MKVQDLNASVDSLLARLMTDVASVSFELKMQDSTAPIAELLNENLLGGGKRFRPMLCFLVGRAFGIPLNRLSAFARAVELTHCASLAHDDVIDRSTTRRDRPTLHTIVGEVRAVLSGDILLAQVMSELLQPPEEPARIRLTHSLSEAIRELSIGEWLETAQRGKVPTHHSELERILELKTGSLTRWCAEVGPTLAGASDSVISEARLFGAKVGIAFQLMDDVLDFEHGTGKPFAQDRSEGVINTVSLELITQQKIGNDFWTVELKPEWVIQAQQKIRHRSAELLSQAHSHLETALKRASSEGLSTEDNFIRSGELASFLSLINTRKK